MPRATSPETPARIVALRLALHASPIRIRILATMGWAASTVGAVIRREGLAGHDVIRFDPMNDGLHKVIASAVGVPIRL